MFRKKINSTYGIIKAAMSLLLVISLTGCSLSGGDKKAENTKAPASTVKQAEVKTLSKEDAFAKAADGKATKIIIPSEIQGLAGLAKSVTEIAKEN